MPDAVGAALGEPAVLGAVLCAGVAGALLVAGSRRATRRLTTLVPSDSQTTRQRHDSNATGIRDQTGRGAAAVAIAVAAALAVGGVFGLFVGALAGCISWATLARAEPRARRRRRARIVADLPVAVDLLAACLRGGVPWGEAVEAVADAIGGPLGVELQMVAARVRLGADPARAWLALAGEPELTSLARTVARAVHSGTALAPTLARLAADQRRVACAAATARAKAAGVRAVAPLGLCFLPAFALVGVVPAIVGIASTILLPW